MRIVIEDPNLTILLLIFLICFILFQIYLLFKIRKIVLRLLKIYNKIDNIAKEFSGGRRSKKGSKLIRTCQTCKNRLVYFHSEDESYFYMKCRLNNQMVNPEDFCHYFVFDPQSYEI